jgi:hypothetical protein
MLRQDKVGELMEKLEQEKEESFEKAKARWIKVASENNEQFSDYLDALFYAVASTLYKFLKIKPTKEIPELQALREKMKSS